MENLFLFCERKLREILCFVRVKMVFLSFMAKVDCLSRAKRTISTNGFMERKRTKNKEREKLEICVNHNRRLRYMRMKRMAVRGFERVAKIVNRGERELNDCWENCCMKFMSACVDNAKIL